jgi:hypothetical protein
MQDVGSKEDTELSREDLTLSWRELSVESLEHCQSVGNWMFFPPGFARNGKPKSIPFPGRTPCQHGVSRLVARRDIESFGGTG